MADGAKLEGAMIALRLRDPEQIALADGEPIDVLHLTLAFLAEDASALEPAAIEAAHDAANEASNLFGPIGATIAGFGVLGAADPPAVVLLLNGAEIDGIRDVVWAELRDFGSEAFQPQHEPFIPHITVGYGLSFQAEESRLTELIGQTITLDGLSVDIGGEQILYSLSERVTAAYRSRQRKHGGGKFKSEDQRRWMWAVVPRAAKKWAHNRKTAKIDWAGAKRPKVRRD